MDPHMRWSDDKLQAWYMEYQEEKGLAKQAIERIDQHERICIQTNEEVKQALRRQEEALERAALAMDKQEASMESLTNRGFQVVLTGLFMAIAGLGTMALLFFERIK
jgi:hypothetical protein